MVTLFLLLSRPYSKALAQEAVDPWEIWDLWLGKINEGLDLQGISLPAKSSHDAKHPCFPSNSATGACNLHERKRFKSTFFLCLFTFLGMTWISVYSTHCILCSLFERPKPAWAPIVLPWSWALQSQASCCCHSWSNTCSQSPGFVFLHQHFSCSL